MSRLKIVQNDIAVIDGDTHLSKWIVEQGKLDIDGEVNRICDEFVRDGDICIDAGASLGDTTKAFLKRVGLSGMVYAFEPNPETFQCLAYNCPEAVCRCMALGKESAKRMIYPALENIGATWVSPQQPGNTTVVSLDDFRIPRLKVLKMDVEGMEPEIIAGARLTIMRCRPVIVAELNRGCLQRIGWTQQMLVDQIVAFGYEIHFFEPSHAIGQDQIDVYFTPTAPKSKINA
jgi:FkbM family methyltransferase